MATPAKKQSFLGGAAILTAAVVIVKLIGAAYKIPLSNILGSAGQTYFDTAYQIYNFLLTFSTAGLPPAISRMTSQAHAQGLGSARKNISTEQTSPRPKNSQMEVRKIFRFSFSSP